MSTPTHIKELTPDPENRRKHNPRNLGMVTDALHQVGAARSIVIDEDNVILAGNGVTEAAAEAGITKVQVIDVDGETLVAVRRTGLTPEQKRALAIYDNRTAELAEWDAEQLQADLDAGLSLEPWFSDQEQATALADKPASDDWNKAIGTLPNGEKSPFQQMTFTLSDEQAEQVKAALDASKALGPFVDTGNENSNGNALARVCETFLTVGASA
jgi:ParB family transcriptional regulator, chromosome partitioning protein